MDMIERGPSYPDQPDWEGGRWGFVIVEVAGAEGTDG